MTKASPQKAARRRGKDFEQRVAARISKCPRLIAEVKAVSGRADLPGESDVHVWEEFQPGVLVGSSRRVLQCKKRKDGFKQIYSWLEGNDALVIAADRKPPLVVIPLDDWIKIIGGGE